MHEIQKFDACLQKFRAMRPNSKPMLSGELKATSNLVLNNFTFSWSQLGPQ